MPSDNSVQCIFCILTAAMLIGSKNKLKVFEETEALILPNCTCPWAYSVS